MATSRSIRSFLALLSASAIFVLPHQATAVTYDVSASGDGMDLSQAMALAGPGDSVSLADGTYDRALVSVTSGEAGSPITVVGGSGAIINGDYSSRSVLIQHSYITLNGFTVEGKVGSGSDSEAYVDKCVYVEGIGSLLDGFVMEDMAIQNCGSECVRLKNGVVNAQIIGNTILDCGIYDYQFDSGDKNGEGIYIGTATSQWTDGPDECKDNLVEGNVITTNANECVDIKEGATGNTVEYNICANQLDEDSGCFDSRGDDNTFCYNVGSNCLGAGVRLGGHEVDGYEYGQGNDVFGNDFTNVGVGAIKVETLGQGEICGNTCEDGTCGVTGSLTGNIAETWNQACGDITSSLTSPESPTTTTTTTSTTSEEGSSSDSPDSSASSEEQSSSSSPEESSRDDSSYSSLESSGEDSFSTLSAVPYSSSDTEMQMTDEEEDDDSDDDNIEDDSNDDDRQDRKDRGRSPRGLRGGSRARRFH